MNFVKGAVLTCVALTGATQPAQAAFKSIYDVLGVLDNGAGAGLGIATSIHCSNTSANPVNVRVFVRRGNGDIVGTVLIASITGQGSRTFSTHGTTVFGDASLNTGLVAQGRARIQTEVPQAIVCAADLVDAGNSFPAFIAPRRMIRLPRDTSGGED